MQHMRRTVVATVAGTAAVVAVVVWLRSRRSAGADRWHSVTVNRARESLGERPVPLGSLGDRVEVLVRPAPDGKGTELAARLVDQADLGGVRRLRQALREARQLAEVGEVLLPDAPSTTRWTLTSRPLNHAIQHARGEGRL